MNQLPGLTTKTIKDCENVMCDAIGFYSTRIREAHKKKEMRYGPVV